MAAALAHRGPDARGSWVRGSVGLAHRMLRTTPESLHETLPLVDDSAGLALTADARIDNRGELMSALGAAETATDSELILRAYAHWGERCPEHLVGDFAFALWDSRRQRLLLVRDHLGIKPLLHAHAGAAFVFGSELGPLVAAPGIRLRVSEPKIAEYLGLVPADETRTSYDGVSALPPGAALVVSASGVRSWRYWSLDTPRELRRASDGELAEEFAAKLGEAVRCRVRSAFPVGSMLSGGLDSSSVTCVARALLPASRGPLKTFSIVFSRTPSADESRYIDHVIRGDGLEPTFLDGDAIAPFEHMGEIHARAEELFFMPNASLQWSLYEATAAAGVRVLLNGEGGDQLLSHAPFQLLDLLRARRVRDAARFAGALSGGDTRLASTLLWQFGLRPLVPARARGVARALRFRAGLPSRALAGAGFARRVGAVEPVARSSREYHVEDLRRHPPQPLLDRGAAAFGFEPRYPFLDLRLVEFALALPPDQRLHPPWTRPILRRALRGTLPEEIRLRRTKATAASSVTRNLLDLDRARLEGIVVTQTPAELGTYIDLGALRRRFAQLGPAPEWSAVAPVWRAANLGLWLNGPGRFHRTTVAAV